jgi:tetratricopeptide (TPR) repeat protein
MAKELAAVSKRNGKPVRRRRRSSGTHSVHPPVEPALSPATTSESSIAPSGDAQWRFLVASLLRVSDNLMNRVLRIYDGLFALDRRDQADIYLQMGKELSQRGRLEDAVETLRKALELKPDEPLALLEIGSVHLRRGAPQAALEALEKARSLGQPSYRLHTLLVETLTRQDRNEEALAELECALKIRPRSAENHYRLGVVLDRLGRFEEAVGAFEKAIELAPDQVVYYQTLGFTLESMGRRRAAITCFKRALELERGSPKNMLAERSRGVAS